MKTPLDDAVEKWQLARTEIVRLEAERDQLLAALRGLLNLETRYTNCGLREFDAARAAIAKATQDNS